MKHKKALRSLDRLTLFQVLQLAVDLDSTLDDRASSDTCDKVYGRLGLYCDSIRAKLNNDNSIRLYGKASKKALRNLSRMSVYAIMPLVLAQKRKVDILFSSADATGCAVLDKAIDNLDLYIYALKWKINQFK